MIRSIIILLSVISAAVAFGQDTVVIPKFNDTYCKYIRKLEDGETGIDYKDFRFSFISSEQFKVAADKFSKLDTLTKQMYKAMGRSDYPGIIKVTKEMLSIDYTNMMAHKQLRQALKITGDTLHSNKYKAIQFGLLKSIVNNGDGKTCKTAWPVIQIEEEYFILQMMNADLQSQSIDHDGGICDRMDVVENGVEKTYYFNTSKVFEGYKKLGIK